MSILPNIINSIMGWGEDLYICIDIYRLGLDMDHIDDKIFFQYDIMILICPLGMNDRDEKLRVFPFGS